MKRCPCCGVTFTDEPETCPKCNCYLDATSPDEEVMRTAEYKAKRKRDWIWIIVGVPAMLALIYGAYWLLQTIWH